MAFVTSPLLGCLNQALQTDRPTLISIDGHGSISVYPRQQSCTTDIHDWDSLPLTDGSSIRVGASVWSTPPDAAMPVSELQWLAAYHYACQLRRTQPVSKGLVKLLHWPDLCGVPYSISTAIVRICALLWRKPCASTLLARISGTDQGQAEALMMVMAGLGYLEISTGFTEIPTPEMLHAETTNGHPSAQGSKQAKVIAKLWHRLLEY